MNLRSNPVNEEAINNPPATLSLRSDGVLQSISGDLVTVTYDDVLNDYGNGETITTSAIYGGWSGRCFWDMDSCRVIHML